MDNSQATGTDPSQDEILSDILKKITFTNASPSDSTPQNPPSSAGSGDILSAFLSNPELIAKLPTIVATVRPIIEMLGKNAAVSASAPSSSPTSTVESVAASAVIAPSHGNDSRTALLCAMKPYLGSERQNAIDYVIKLGRLSEILKTL